MGSGPEPAGNEVGPTEGVIQKLMETLVDPFLLPLSVSGFSPQEDDQKSVAKQMHVVALIYNYHYRKQEPDLKFLDLVSFSKLAVALKPPLVSFMKLTVESQPTKSNISNDHLSMTEKSIKDACDIALSLDSSKDFPDIKEWPVSKVAVLLIDRKKENCMLRFGDVTKGAWSLIEKEVTNESNKVSAKNVLLEEKVGDKRKWNNLLTYDNELLQLGYDAVKDATGIRSSELKVLWTRVTYSSSKEKSAVQFYMMQCPRIFSVKEEVSLSFLVKSLQGSFSEKLGYGICAKFIEFYHLLPYVEFISCWHSGKDLCSPTIKGQVSQSIEPDLAVPKANGHNNSSGMKVNSSRKMSTENCEKEKARNLVILENEKIKAKSQVSHAVYSRRKLTGIDNLKEKFDKKGDTANKDMDECGKNTLLSPDFLKGLSTNVESGNTSKKTSRQLVVYQYKRRKNSPAPKKARVLEDGDNLKVMVHISEKVNQVIQSEDQTNYNLEPQNVSVEKVHNALALLHEKRQELYSEMRNTEGTLATCESDIAGISDGPECIKSIMNWNDKSMIEHVMQIEDYGEPQCDQKKTKRSKLYFPGNSSCEDLEYICLKNNWRLPRYLIAPSDGKFVSSVYVCGEEKLYLKGGSESKPCEAMESAAARIIAELRNF